MTMGTSRTKKRQIKKLAESMAVEKVMDDLMGAYVDIWAHKELDNLIKSGFLVFMPISNGYQIGKYSIVKVSSGRWQVLNQWHETMAELFNNQSAVFYAIFEQQKQYSKSQELLLQDRIVGNLLSDYELYRHKYKRACSTQDAFGCDLCMARLSDLTPKLAHASDQLKKLVKLAKYNKVWERNHEITRTRKQGDSQAH